MLLSLLAGMALAPRDLDFYADGPYDPAVPRPEAILRYGPGERHSTFRDQEAVILAIANAAHDRVKVIEYGRTPEGRPLRVLAISSPRNIARLESLRADHEAIANGKGDPAKTIPFVWVNECIHGDETASFEAGMWTLYNLAAARGGRLAKALDSEVVFLNPVYNPDGHERYVVYYNSIATGSPRREAFEAFEPSVIFGRLNHYRFDMNRDRVAFSQDETRQEFAQFLKWNPQVYVDQHGQVGSYFFPPEPMSVNANVDRARNAKWTGIFGHATAKAFDQRGFSYFVKDQFDLFYPGYLDASTTLSGAIGMTHETDGGRVLASERADGSRLTLRRGIEKHFTSALAIVVVAAENAGDLMRDYAKFKADAVSGASAGNFKRVVLQGDSRALTRLSTQLQSAGISSYFAAEAFNQPNSHDYWSAATGTHSFPQGAMVVDIAQPQAALAKALLEPTGGFEPEFVKAQVAGRKAAPEGETYPGPEGAEFYDFTGWSLPYAHNLAAWWCENAPALRKSATVSAVAVKRAASTIGYAIPYRDDRDILAAADALLAGVKGSVTTRPMTLGGNGFASGTFLFLADHNEEGYERLLWQAASKRGASVLPLTTAYPDVDRSSPGSESTIALRKPAIGIVMGNGMRLGESGAIWYLMDRVFDLPFTPINGDSFGRADLSRYTCLIVPEGANVPVSKVHDWVETGNVVVATGGIGWALGSSNFVELADMKGDPAELPGSLFRAEMDSRSFLSFGYGPDHGGKISIAVPLAGSSFYHARKEGGSVVTFSSDEKAVKLLSGWAWPDDTEKNLRGAVWLQDVPVGRGHAILFTQDPTARAMWPGLYKMLLNAMIVGSGQ